MKGSSRLKQRLLAVLIGLTAATLALYVLLNLTLVYFVPILHSVEFEIEVADASSKDPIDGARVARRDISDQSPPIGKTNADGVLTFSMTLQHQPIWFYPLLGTFDSYPLQLRVLAPGYETKLIDTQVLGGEPLSTDHARVQVLLEREGR